MSYERLSTEEPLTIPVSTIDALYLEDIRATRAEQLKMGIIVINTNFDATMMEAIYFKLTKLRDDNNVREIKIYINSNGGACSALFAITDLINSITKPVSTIVMGYAYSAGAMLLLSGHPGRRFAHENSEILLHEVASDYGYKKNLQMQHLSKKLDRVNGQLVQMLKTRTKLTQKDIEKFMKSNTDIFITAREALKYGVIDKII